ncbi:MAG TPA: agmatinase family protein [Kiritimatiellia bacterium]|nr:agmatinase family protein [Kiritimatiellia bacterium]HMP34955.1 agmatinase family protein [Kiritimatiellia bacterium]
MNVHEKIAAFDPNDLGRAGSNLFGLPFTPGEARVVVIPVPWEVTVSYGGGTLHGPRAVYNASKQVDLFDPYLPDAWKVGVAMEPIPVRLAATSRSLRGKAERYIAKLERGIDPARDPAMRRTQAAINNACAAMVDDVERRTARRLDQGKLVALLGGDHSTPLGFLKALAGRHRSFGVLQIDAHADLRDAYEGFTYSHASIMFNALRIPQIKRLVQAGIRDYCQAEAELIRASKGRVVTWFDRDLKQQLYRGRTVAALHRAIVSKLPDKVYVSFDIDGLDPKLCPNTGTPVPGGFEFEEAVQLVQAVADSGRTIIGLDINEVSPRKDEWDANVGARLLFRLINIMAKSHRIRP